MGKRISFIALFSLGIIMLFSACVDARGNTPAVQGIGEMVSRSFQVEDFTELDIGGFFTVVFNQSDEIAVYVEMQENLFDYHDVSVRRGTLLIRPTRNNRVGIEFGDYRPRVYIHAPYLTSINFSGSVRTENWDTIQTQALSVVTSGFVGFSAPLEVSNLSIDTSGSSTIELWGNATDVNITASGLVNIMASDLQTTDVAIDGSGSTRAELSASSSIDATLSGFANIRYIGNPTITQNISGSGSIRRME